MTDDVNREHDLGTNPTKSPGSDPRRPSTPGQGKPPFKPSVQQGGNPKPDGGSSQSSGGGRESGTEKAGSTTSERDRREKSPKSDSGKDVESDPQGTQKRGGEESRERAPARRPNDPENVGTEGSRDRHDRRKKDEDSDDDVEREAGEDEA